MSPWQVYKFGGSSLGSSGRLPLVIRRVAEAERPLALVVRSDIHMGLARMLSAYSHMSGLNVEVFTTVEEAYDWLQFQTGRKPHSSRRTKASGRLVGPS